MPPLYLYTVHYATDSRFFAEYCALWLLARGQLHDLQFFIVISLWECSIR